MNEKTAIVLGGTNPHIQLLNKLKDRGFYTILVDYYPNPPAKPFADEHVQASTMDKEAVLGIALKYKAALVITTNIDQANTTACYVAEQLNLPHPYSYETALNVTDKSRMKRIMWDNGISTSVFISCKTLEEVDSGKIKYPVVVKPSDSKGSRGVHKCNDFSELRLNFKEAKNASTNGSVVIEGFVEGTEVSFYYFIQDYTAHYITSNQRFRFRAGTEGVIQSAGGLYPVALPQVVYDRMQDNANRIARAFHLNNSPIFIQAIATEDDVYVIEFAPRIGGGLSYRLIEGENHFDIINATIDSFLGLKPVLAITQPDYFSAVMNVYAPGVIMGELGGIKDVIRYGLAKEFFQYKMRGSEVSSDMSSGSRIGGFYIQGKDAEEIYEKIHRINSLIEVFDINGNAVMRHDIYDI